MGKNFHTGAFKGISACPHCDRVYDNHRILNMHLKKTHGSVYLTDKDVATMNEKCIQVSAKTSKNHSSEHKFVLGRHKTIAVTDKQKTIRD
jgi:uncharacterized C2H2 Zn-finger protein